MIPLAVLLVNHHTVTVALPLAKGLYRVLRNPAADVLLTLLVVSGPGCARSTETLFWLWQAVAG